MVDDTENQSPIYKKWWFWLIIFTIIAFIAMSGGEENEVGLDPNEAEEDSNQIANELEEDHEDRLDDDNDPNSEQNGIGDEPSNDTTFNTGTYRVGDEIQPGLYRSSGNITYWARLSGFSGELDDIIANGNPAGVAIVEIKEGDEGFESSGEGQWIFIKDDYEGELRTKFSDGTYIVGKDIEPGRYRSNGGGEFGGYWERLANFSGELEDIIANGNSEEQTIVEIKESDRGFRTSGGLTWTKIE
ncbi:hypothetical protein [Salirhabdus salicampi]|uniref:hypothetical protein n=1 Tax=Salirhabdus salicampi TaxID=476102 RepID=UPI0020C1FCA7|nr:hypothetical protein [Salirhabdus salicampi]MCP8615748.1 hypothetical protein [Salirhabdus salicampi]